MDILKSGRIKLGRALAVTAMLSMAACSTLGQGGPSSSAISKADGVLVGHSQIKVIDVTDAVARRVMQAQRLPLLSEAIGDAAPTDTVIGRGDLLQVTIWEAPPALTSIA